jgi:hypothetical protein
MATASTPVAIEQGKKNCIAFALDWPGWCRIAKTEDAALELLADYHDRYALIAAAAGHPLPKQASARFSVAERLVGGSGTDWGVPETIADAQREPASPKSAARLADFLAAAWIAFDAGVAGSSAMLRKGPRGGGRDRDKMVAHVEESEQAYCSALGLSRRTLDTGNRTVRRAAMLEVIRSGSTTQRWPIRYAANRLTWHVLDHLWEIEDKQT